MPILTITEGLPGSGKSTWAEQQQAADPSIRLLGRDRVRRMIGPSPWPHGNEDAEEACTIAQHWAVRGLLLAGHDVIVDDTNLLHAHSEAFYDLAESMDDVRVRTRSFFDVPIELCIARDETRPEDQRVGEARIRAMWQEHLDELAQIA